MLLAHLDMLYDPLHHHHHHHHLDMLYDPLLVLHGDEGGALAVPLRDSHAGELLHVLQGHPVILAVRPHQKESEKF